MAMLRLSKLPLVDKFVDAFRVFDAAGAPLMLQILLSNIMPCQSLQTVPFRWMMRRRQFLPSS